MSAERQFIETTLENNDVVVFSKSYCPYCKKVKGLFDSLGVKYTAVELDTRQDGSTIQEELAAKTNQRTVPNVFVKGQHVGGSDSTHAAHSSGKLKELLDGPRR